MLELEIPWKRLWLTLLFSNENKIIAQRKMVVKVYTLMLSLLPHTRENKPKHTQDHSPRDQELPKEMDRIIFVFLT